MPNMTPGQAEAAESAARKALFGKASPDPTFDNPNAHGATAPLIAGDKGGLTQSADPQPERAGRKSFGVNEGDQ